MAEALGVIVAGGRGERDEEGVLGHELQLAPGQARQLVQHLAVAGLHGHVASDLREEGHADPGLQLEDLSVLIHEVLRDVGHVDPEAAGVQDGSLGRGVELGRREDDLLRLGLGSRGEPARGQVLPEVVHHHAQVGERVLGRERDAAGQHVVPSAHGGLGHFRLGLGHERFSTQLNRQRRRLPSHHSQVKSGPNLPVFLSFVNRFGYFFN